MLTAPKGPERRHKLSSWNKHVDFKIIDFYSSATVETSSSYPWHYYILLKSRGNVPNGFSGLQKCTSAISPWNRHSFNKLCNKTLSVLMSSKNQISSARMRGQLLHLYILHSCKHTFPFISFRQDTNMLHRIWKVYGWKLQLLHVYILHTCICTFPKCKTQKCFIAFEKCTNNDKTSIQTVAAKPLRA